MKMKRFLTFVMSVIMLASSLSGISAFADTNRKDWRMVGIHAQTGDNIAPDKPSKLYYNEPANIYLSVDKPNKGNPDRSEAHYDLNGFSVKFYYDDAFFDLNTKTPNEPIDYKIPDKTLSDSTDNEMGENVPSEGASYYPYKHGAFTEEINGKQYQVAYATVLYSGSWLPEKDVKWYDICALPIIPKLTGTTEVYVEYGTTDEYSLELYSKNKPGETTKNFDLTVVNGGRHTIIIEDQPKPPAPVVTPKQGTYPEKQTITISAEPNCEIYYSLNGASEQKYTGPFDITTNTTLVCYAKSTVGEMRESDRVTCEYKISAQRPYLFKSDKLNLVPDRYDTETNPYKVYFSDTSDQFRDIPDGTEIYYTFRKDIGLTNPVQTAASPDDGWVQVAKRMPELNVESPCTVRMFTDKYGVYSQIVEYELLFSPSVVNAVDFANGAALNSGKYDSPIEVKLITSTPGAEIYYTLDGTSPLAGFNRYDPQTPIVISGNKTLRAVAKVGDTFGPVMTNWYVIKEDINDYGVIAFYPSGKYEGEANVALIPENPEYSVEYKTDTDTNWKPYNKNNPISVKDNTTITARAIDKDGNTNGEEFNFTYIIIPKPPVFTPESAQFVNASEITVYSPDSSNTTTSKYDLYYTLDGTWPITQPTDGSDPVLSDSASVIHADAQSDSAVIPISKYTVVTAVVCKDGKYFSSVVQQSYDIVKQKLVKPLTTLTPGNYIHTLDMPDDFDFETFFLPVTYNTEIYYTVSYNGEEYCPDPIPNTTINGTKYYDKNNPEPIIIKGNTVIKAVAVNRFGAMSDVAIFEYNVTHEAPWAPPGDVIAGTVLPTVPVKTVEGSNVTYKVGDFENTIENAPSDFYIDTSTGNAYLDPNDPSTILGQQSGKNFSDSVMLEISSEHNGVNSDTNYYTYAVSGDANDQTTIAAPYADKLSGRYDEVDIDGENSLLVIRLYSLNQDARIQYMLNNSSQWIDYNPSNPIKLKDGDDVLQARCVRGSGDDMKVSKVASYSYVFYPIAPLITLDSGWYSKEPLKQTQIMLDEASKPHSPYNKYEIHYRRNGDPGDYFIKWDNKNFFIDLDHSMSVKAYVLNTTTKRSSPAVVRYYIIEGEASVGGAVEMQLPYYGVRRIARHIVGEAPWNQGIKLYTDNISADVDIYYKYTRVYADGTSETSNTIKYDSASPIAVTNNTQSIQIEAWLVNGSGEIAGTRRVFDKIIFDTYDAPKTSLEDSDSIQFAPGTGYTILHDPAYKDDPKMTLYYTTDGNDPVIYDSVTGQAILKGTQFKDGDAPLILNGDTTVKTVYRSACGICYYCDKGDYDHCQNVVYGKIGTYRYVTKANGGMLPSGSHVGGGGGGGGSSSVSQPTRVYTKDIFGNEHPTHIGYINGYPDGSVKPDGNITREETAAILYRIKNKAYDEPFTVTGEVFPDVDSARWSALNVEYMTADGVINGYPDGEFKPTKNLTRAEFAALIRRFIDAEYPDDIKNTFGDLDESHWAYNDIMALSEIGLINGYEDETYRPENKITRAEVMTVINKLLGRNPSESYVKSLGFNPFNDLDIEKWYYVIVLEATVTHNYYLDNKKLEIKWEDYK